MDADYALFADIVDAGSLSAAARRRGMSPAMASKRLARLEARLGARLIHRTTRRLTLTDAGERFHAAVVDILARIHLAEEQASGTMREPAGLLRISIPTSFGRLHVAPHLHAFLAAWPRIALDVHLSDGFVDFMADRVDVAVRITATVPAAMTAIRLATSRRILCAAPAYLAEHGVPDGIAALARHRLLAADGQMPWRLVNGQRRAAIDERSHVRTNSSELVRELALSGVGIALRSLWDVDDALRRGALARVLPDWEGSRDVGIYAIHHGGPAVTPAVAAFVAFLKERVAAASPGDEAAPTTR